MTVLEAKSVKSYGNLSLVILAAKPASLTSPTSAEVAAGKNVTCHQFGDWLPTATTEKATRGRRMCQTRQGQSLGSTTYETPALQYSYDPQAVGTPGAPGNEAYEICPEGAVVYALQRLGKGGTTDLVATDKVRVIVLELGAQVPGVSQDDAGGEFVINQETALASGYTAPIDAVIAS